MAIPGRKIPKERMLEAVSAAGVDMARLEKDRKAHQGEIATLLQRNLDQADALGLQGTPVFLIGPLKVAALDYDGFKQAVAQARARGRS
jgi:protein-disulfide isomerase